jgi:hypothetical protein
VSQCPLLKQSEKKYHTSIEVGNCMLGIDAFCTMPPFSFFTQESSASSSDFNLPIE